jgi:hypothetical protein
MRYRGPLPKEIRNDYRRLEKMIEDALNYIKFVRGKNKRLWQLAEVAESYLRWLVPVDSGELVDSIELKPEYELHGRYNYLVSITITLNAPYAKFVEFGTGVIGQNNPHKEADNVGWDYDINDHGEKGWVYYNKKTGRFFWTKGEEPSAFLYKTFLMLESMIGSTVTNKKWYGLEFDVDENTNPYIRIYKE